MEKETKRGGSKLTVKLAPPFRDAFESVRERLPRRQQILFDMLATAGHLGRRLPYNEANLRFISGARDPRKRLSREFSRKNAQVGLDTRAGYWKRSGKGLAAFLLRELDSKPEAPSWRALRVLLGNAPIALAPDCVVPSDPVLNAAWTSVVQLFAQLYSSTVRPLGRLDWLDRRLMAKLKREAQPGRRKGRPASGQRPGMEGRKLAVDPRLMALVKRALGKEVRPGYEARYVFYTKPGDHFWPHPDDPEYPVNVLFCIDRKLPAGESKSSASAFLAYRPDGSVERYELAAGTAIVVEARGVVHGREPMKPGEQVTLLSINLHLK